MSRIDAIYRRLLLTKFFTKGWGNPEGLLRIIALRQSIKSSKECSRLISSDYPVHIDQDVKKADHRLIEGHFISPFHKILPDIMPAEVQTAKFQGIFPLEWSGDLKPVVIHLAGTGDHPVVDKLWMMLRKTEKKMAPMDGVQSSMRIIYFFWRRRSLFALPMLKKYCVASILLENPYYGYRKPKGQLRSSLHHISDLFAMGGALILESAVLFNWCERNGYGPLGITGISMGGYMASLAACNWHKPVSLIPCLSWTTASSVFTEGVLSRAIPWQLLESQYRSNPLYKQEVWPRIHSPETSLMEQVSMYNCQQSTPRLSAENKTTITSATSSNQRPKNKTAKVDPEVFTFMKTLMDEFTHLGNFPKPVDTDLVIVTTAVNDAYVPIQGYVPLNHLWPGIEARHLNHGHISSFLLEQNSFKDAIRDSIMKQILKYHPNSTEAVSGLRGSEKPRIHKFWSPLKLIHNRLDSSL